MLFNTLAYAKFFAIVFVTSWLLVARRWVLLAPFIALLAYVVLHPISLPRVAIAAASFAASYALSVRATRGERVPLAATLASVLINYGALAFLSYRDLGTDPASAALRALGMPLPTTRGFGALALLVVPLLAILVLRAKKVRLLFLLLASYVFYAHWDYRFLPLIFASSTADWLLANAIARSSEQRLRKLWLAGTVGVNLGVLALFKYFNFGLETARAMCRALGLHPPQIALELTLPIGISFFTFESMSYVIDVYRGRIEPQKSYLEYLSFVAFFPHLVAGPIVRPRDLLPQLAGEPRWNPSEGSEALFLIAVGLLKKVAIGDYLALNLVDRVFDAPLQYSGLECYAAVLGYAVQIYCDFSGYTDIAIGSALLLGVRFPLNFDAPYKAASIADFWRRWHISLSTWLRDYLYIPLGGNRRGSFRTYCNLMITMLLGGLWHGANWTFVAWGGLHGAGLAFTRALTEFRQRRGRQSNHSPLYVFLCVVATFHLVCAAWIFFRAETFTKAWLVFTRLAELSTHHANLPLKIVAVLVAGLISHFVPERAYVAVRDGFVRLPAPAQGFALFAAALALSKMASAEAVPFVYFQF